MSAVVWVRPIDLRVGHVVVTGAEKVGAAASYRVLSDAEVNTDPEANEPGAVVCSIQYADGGRARRFWAPRNAERPVVPVRRDETPLEETPPT